MEECLERIKKEVAQTQMLILYFSNKSCGACAVIRKKVGQILMNYPKVEIIDLDGEKEPKLSAQYSAFSTPLLILFVEGKEVIRVGRYFDFLKLEGMISRHYELLFED